LDWSRRVVCGTYLIVSAVVPVRTPFRYVSQHVEQTKAIWSELAHRRCEGPSVFKWQHRPPWFLMRKFWSCAGVPVVGCSFKCRNAVAGPASRGCTSAARVLPFSLRRQSVNFALPAAEPLAERHRVVPSNIHNGMFVRLFPPDIFPVVRVVRAA